MLFRDNLRLLKVADSSMDDSASASIKPEICDGISLICQRIVRRMGFARDPESRALRRRLLIRSALLLSRPQLPPPADASHHFSSNHIARIVRSCPCRLGLLIVYFSLIRFSICSLQGGHVFRTGGPDVGVCSRRFGAQCIVLNAAYTSFNTRFHVVSQPCCCDLHASGCSCVAYPSQSRTAAA